MADAQDDRFTTVDRAIDTVRGELDEAIEGTKSAGSKAAAEVRSALDDAEDRLDDLRDRDDR